MVVWEAISLFLVTATRRELVFQIVGFSVSIGIEVANITPIWNVDELLRTTDLLESQGVVKLAFKSAWLAASMLLVERSVVVVWARSVVVLLRHATDLAEICDTGSPVRAIERLIVEV